MEPLAPGTRAPPLDGAELPDGPVALWFYKVTCPVCQMAAPVAEALHAAHPGRVVGVGQDPPEKLAAFSDEYGARFPSVPDLPPYVASNAWGVRVVPTAFLLDADRTIVDVVESWDREGMNRLAEGLAELSGDEASVVSDPGDGLPPFRPG
jgi:thiol-disulfide isomerase/thioredoxin